MTKDKPFVLVDGSSYLFRAFHALPPLMNSKGTPTGAVYGVINMLRKLINDYQPENIAIIFDPKGKTFRNDLYKEYKANRTEMPDDLRVQIQPIFDIIKAMGLPLVIENGVEADDVIGTLVHQASQKGMHSLVSTGDKDIAQCVNEYTTLINTMTNKLMDPAGVVEKFGVPPELIIDYLTLVGDTSDNIPGVQKVGPKTAVKWLTEYGSLNGVIEHAGEIKGKVGEYLREAIPNIPLYKELVTIKIDLNLAETPSQLKPSKPDINRLTELFTELEFKGWLAELVEDKPPLEKKDYQTVLTESDFLTWIDKLKNAELFCFDTETTSLDYMSAEIVGVSFAVESGDAAYVPVAHDYEGAPKQLERDWVLAQLKPLLEDPKQLKLGQNLKYDMSVLANYDISLQGIAYDTMLESYILQSSGTRHDMNTLALKYLGYKTIHFEEIAGKGAKQITFNQVHLEEATPYAAEDADITLQLHENLLPKLNEESGPKEIFTELEMPLVPVLSRIERNGVLIDCDRLAKQSEEMAVRIVELENEAYQIAGTTFNLSSTKQLQEILFDKLNLPVTKKTPKGAPSTSESVLQELAYDYPLPKLIMEYRSLSKLKSTYTDSLPLQVNAKTGRVHTSYHQAVTATGRLSSSNPNLQNIPIRTEKGRRIRQAFIASDGYKLIALDYSQIELRIMAHMSEDPGLLKAFQNGWDVHQATAAEIFGVALDAVTKDQRREAKVINFGLIYGMSAFGLSKQLGTDRGAAQEYMDLYFQRYPGVQTYMQSTRDTAHAKGYVETLYGRRLHLPEIHSSNRMRMMAAERTAINAPMQGTAADIIKRAMINVDAWLQKGLVDARMIMQVHDELVFEVADKDVDASLKQFTYFMEHAADLSVKLIVDVGVGLNWDEAH